MMNRTSALNIHLKRPVDRAMRTGFGATGHSSLTICSPHLATHLHWGIFGAFLTNAASMEGNPFLQIPDYLFRAAYLIPYVVLFSICALPILFIVIHFFSLIYVHFYFRNYHLDNSLVWGRFQCGIWRHCLRVFVPFVYQINLLFRHWPGHGVCVGSDFHLLQSDHGLGILLHDKFVEIFPALGHMRKWMEWRK